MSILDKNIDPNVKLGDYYKVTLFWQLARIDAAEQERPVMLPCDLVQLHQSGPPHTNLKIISDIKLAVEDHDEELSTIMSMSADTDDDVIEEMLQTDACVKFRTPFVNLIKCPQRSLNTGICYMLQVGHPIDSYGRPITLIGTPYITFTPTNGTTTS